MPTVGGGTFVRQLMLGLHGMNILCVLKFATVMAVNSCAVRYSAVCKQTSGPEIDQLSDEVRSHLGTLPREREKLKVEISNLAAVIAQGRQSPALLAELEKRERRLTEISEEIFSSSGNGLDAKLKEIEDFVMRRLCDIHGLLTGDVRRAKSELAKHCTEITLTPERKTCKISGDWNLLGARSDGAGGQNCM